MKLSDLKTSGHLPTLVSAFLYFDVSFLAWTLLGPLGAQIGATLHMTPVEKFNMVAVPTLAGAFLRIVLGFAVDRIGAKRTGILAQLVVMAGFVSCLVFRATFLRLYFSARVNSWIRRRQFRGGASPS